MTSNRAFAELLGRIGLNKGAVVLVSEEELAEWPESAVRSMKDAGLLAPASPVYSVVCPGCEQQCSMPVHTHAAGSGRAASFIVCDKRDDISRVPVSAPMLRQWAASLASVAELLARSLELPGPVRANGARYELGVLRGRRHSSHVVLQVDGKLTVRLGGHVVDLLTLKFDGQRLRVDRRALERLVDNPIGGAGDTESGEQRRKRLAREVKAEKDHGNRAYLKTIAAREGISTQRLKQILDAEPKPAQKRASGSSRRSS